MKANERQANRFCLSHFLLQVTPKGAVGASARLGWQQLVGDWQLELPLLTSPFCAAGDSMGLGREGSAVMADRHGAFALH